jgi:mycothiol synthase
VAEVELRPASVEDASAIAEICNALTQDLYGDADVDAQGVSQWFAMPDIGMFLAGRAGRAVGYADVRRDEDGARFPIDVRVHPDARGRGVADALVASTEDWARRGAREGALMRAFVAERDDEYREAAEHRGYELIRHSFNMEIDLPEVPEPPEWPEGMMVRTYDAERDEQAVYECTQESFADHWDFRPIPLERWRSFNTTDPRLDPTLWWLVEDGDELAAVCLNHWHFSGDPRFGWVGTLGVRSPWRRRGLGLALLRHSFADFARRGATRVGLGVDAENTTGAVRLYERAGMRPVRRHDTYERSL